MKECLIALLVVFSLLSCAGKGGRPETADDGEDMEEVEPADTLTAEEEAEEEFEELISEEPMPVSAEELFDDFIFNFASNKRLQSERISFPLIVNSGSKVDTIQKDDWQTEHFFMHQGEYSLIFDSEEQMEQVKSTAVSEAIVEKIFLDKSFIRQYLFSRNSGRWMLTEIRNQTLAHNPNASFLEFYKAFVTDSAFQHESLCDEIDFVGPDPDDDFAQMEGVITPDFWDAFSPELPQHMIYNIVYGRQNADADKKIFVIRGISNGQEIEVTFIRRNGHWKLRKLME